MTTILILLIIHCLAVIILKPKNKSLHCGLFGWLGEFTEDLSKDKVNILGIINDSRGGDSCGIASDGLLYKGEGQSREFEDFLYKNNYNKPVIIPSLIGHTRKASVGARNSNNIHPFGFGYLKNKHKIVDRDKVVNKNFEYFEFIGAHNGTLHNYEDLAKEFNVSLTTKQDKITRTKIDSEILLECIYNSKSFDPLSKYIGAAALVWQDLNEPNVVYMFRGASSIYQNSATTSDERPLFVYKQSDNSMYYSSIRNSLLMISDMDEENVVEIDENTVYKITNGDFENAEKTLIDRSSCYQKVYATYSSYSNYNRNWSNNSINNTNKTKELVKSTSKSITTDIVKIPPILSNTMNIYNEDTLDLKGLLDVDIAFRRFQYFSVREEKVLHGAYTFIEHYGFVRISRKVDDLDNYLDKIRSQYIVYEGKFVKKGSVSAKWMPFDNNKAIPLFYFFKGVRVRSKSDFIACIRAVNNKKPFSIKALSMCSSHPIIDNNSYYKTTSNQGIYYNGELFNGTFHALGADRIYEVLNGNLEDVKIVDNNVFRRRTTTVLNNIITANELKDAIETSNKKETNSRVGKQSAIDFAKESILNDEEIEDEFIEYLVDGYKNNNVKDSVNYSKMNGDEIVVDILETIIDKYPFVLDKLNSLDPLVESIATINTKLLIEEVVLEANRIIEEDILHLPY